MRLATKSFEFAFTAPLFFILLASLAGCGGQEANFDKRSSQTDTPTTRSSGPQLPLTAKLSLDASSPVRSDEVMVTLEVGTEAGMDLTEAAFVIQTEGPIEVAEEKRQEIGVLRSGDTRRIRFPVRFTESGEALLLGRLEGVRVDTVEGRAVRHTVGQSDYVSFLVSPKKTYFAATSYHARLDSVKDAYGVEDGEGGVSVQALSPRKRRAYERAVDKLSTGHAETTIIRHDSSKKNEVNAVAAVTIEGTARYEDANGNPHPIRHAEVKIWEEDVLVDDVLASTATDASGHYSATVSGGDLVGDAEVYVQVLARSQAADVAPSGGDTYNTLSDTLSEPTGNVTVDLTEPDTTNEGQAFSIHDALVTGSRYVPELTGSMLPQVAVEFPDPNGSFYSGGTLHINPDDPFDWDVLHHEYGHYVSDQYNLDSSPGGCHIINANLTALSTCGGTPVNYNKDEATRLAWGEGWPTYFGISLQQERNAATLNVPRVGDLDYTDTDIAGNVNFAYSIESQTPFASSGEDNELSVQRILWDLYDGANETRDELAQGDQAVWNTLNGASPVRLSDAWDAFTGSEPVEEVVKYGDIFAEHEVSPDPDMPADNFTLPPDGDVTFEWEANGGGPSFRNDEFTVNFYTKDFSEALFTSPTLTQAQYTVSVADLNEQVFQEVNEAQWVVRGKNTSAPMTGPYAGPARTIKAGGTDVAFIIDDTGSMFEEIAGVRNALLGYLDTFPASDSALFQLTTFKDNVTPRGPTSDLAVIQSQVSALTASGGGDCPEASVEAINLMRDKFKENGRAFLATDASPHAGVNLQSAIAALRAKGVRVDVILSGDCEAFTSRLSGGTGARDRIPFSSNEQGRTASKRSGVGTSSHNRRSAVESFSLMARETGGIFAFVPEVNSYYDDAAKQRFENIAFNIVRGGAAQSVALVAPSTGPAGSRLTVTLTGSGTNFQSGTTLGVEGAGVEVMNVKALSSTRLRATLNVSPGAPLGFRDVVATTDLGGATEVARGRGAFQVTEAPSGPTVTSIAPVSAQAGQTLTVRVDGVKNPALRTCLA